MIDRWAVQKRSPKPGSQHESFQRRERRVYAVQLGFVLVHANGITSLICRTTQHEGRGVRSVPLHAFVRHVTPTENKSCPFFPRLHANFHGTLPHSKHLLADRREVLGEPICRLRPGVNIGSPTWLEGVVHFLPLFIIWWNELVIDGLGQEPVKFLRIFDMNNPIVLVVEDDRWRKP
jgi:hypothetical protein